MMDLSFRESLEVGMFEEWKSRTNDEVIRERSAQL
jgi:hypothetical protein